jgi:hypothetical protein
MAQLRNYKTKGVILMVVLAVLVLSGCYEPKEGCLEVEATNFDVSADNPCDACCEFPKLILEVKHQVVLPTQPDTIFGFVYGKAYPAPFDTTHFFKISRSRFFISNVRLVDKDGNETGVTDTIELEIPAGVFRVVENNFAKIDRDIFQPRTLGVTPANGTFEQVRFVMGLENDFVQLHPASVPEGHPLSNKGDTLIYKAGLGYVSNLLIFRKDTLSDTSPLELRMTEPVQITLPLATTFSTKKGFDIKLTLSVDYLAWWQGVDLKQDDPATIRAKIVQNLPKAFSIAGLKHE